LRAFLRSRNAALLTHGSLVLLFVSMMAILLYWPAWVAIVPCALIHHRIGILLHEYVHGIPFRRYRRNTVVLSLLDGLLLSFGMLEVFRATHLAHHRWLNTDKDPVMQAENDKRAHPSILLAGMALEATQHAKYYLTFLQGKYPHGKRRRIFAGIALSLVWMAFWFAVGRSSMILMLTILNLSTSLASSLRGAIEHHSTPDDPSFANEYRTWIPLFNLNRHVDHHLHPAKPWYLLEFRTGRPLPPRCYWTHWYHAYIKRDYVLMPAPAAPSRSG
jgi:fatty acid desaturase